MCIPFIGVIVLYVLAMKGLWLVLAPLIPEFDPKRKRQFYLMDLLIGVFAYGLSMTIYIHFNGTEYPEETRSWAVLFLSCTATGFLFSMDLRRFIPRDRLFYPCLIVILLVFPFAFLLVVPLWLQWRGWLR